MKKKITRRIFSDIKPKTADLPLLATKDSAAIFKLFSTRKTGLRDNEIRNRLFHYGHNVLVKEVKSGVVKEFLSKFKSPLIILLFVAATLSIIFKERTNAVIIIVMIFLSAILDFIEEHHASQAAKKLLEAVKTTALVRRNGREKEIKTSQIVPGDIIILNSGDLVPADARLIFIKDLFVNQSTLTGESMAVSKEIDALTEEKESLIDLSNMVFAGTNVISGEAEAVVVATGKNTELGKISEVLNRENEKSEFEIGITKFGILIMKIIMFLVLFIFLFNAFVNHRILESFLFAITIAVGITPELLPVIMSVTMSRGSVRMAKKGAIVKKLSAISSFGSMDILCTDKTGTLTEGKIALVKHTDIFGETSEKVLHLAYLNSYFQAGITNSLDEAVKGFRDIDLSGIKKIDEIPYDFTRKRLSVVIEEKGERLLITKGAPEEIFSCVKSFGTTTRKTTPFTKEIKEKSWKIYEQLSSDGFRVLAVAIKKVSARAEKFSKEDEKDLVLSGFICFMDPPKKGVIESINRLEDLGIEIKVITGDNELVTKKICSEIGVKVKGIMLGKDVHNMSDEVLKHRAENTTIFARFSPDEKDRVIIALRNNNHIVGYMGDGINDAPSLKTSDVGLSVNNAVDIAKESADIILTHKSLDILGDGVIEGRKVFGNTMKYIMMGLSSNFGNMFSAAGAVVILPFLPMKPIQILLNNFIYDISQITIPTDNVDDEWTKKPRRWDMKFIKRFMYLFGPISSLFDFFTFFLLYYGFHLGEKGFQTGWFLESLATQTLVIHIIRSKKIPFIQSRPSIPLLISTFGIVIFAWILPFTKLGNFFGLIPLPKNILIALIITVVTYLLIVEVAKRFFYKKHDL